MRRYEISPAIIAAMRSRAKAVAFQEAGVPLHLELPTPSAFVTAYHETDAEDGRIEADGYSFDPEEDDDFY